MHVTTVPTGYYFRPQIALLWLVFVLFAQQYLFNDTMSAAWDRISDTGTFSLNPLVLAQVAGIALVLILTDWHLTLRTRGSVPPAIEAIKMQSILDKLIPVGLSAQMILIPVSGSVALLGSVGAAAQLQNVSKIVLLALIAFHVVGALYHQFIPRGGTLAQMRRTQG